MFLLHKPLKKGVIPLNLSLKLHTLLLWDRRKLDQLKLKIKTTYLNKSIYQRKNAV